MPGSTDLGLRRQSCPVPLVGNSLLGYDHRYGFNGKEGDDEVKGDDNQQDYGMRIYDPRAGRFLSVDPITSQYPELTPYQFASNTPIMAIDLDGLEALAQTSYNNIMTQIQVVRYTENETRFIKISHQYQGKTTTTILSEGGLTENYARENQAKTALKYPLRIGALKAANELANGYDDNRNGFGVITRQMLLNSGQIQNAGDNDAVNSNIYTNAILHFMGQAIFTMLRGEDDAKFVADMHERERPGFFAGEPVGPVSRLIFNDYEDTYRDLINNEYARAFGNQLNAKYGREIQYKLTPQTTANVLNDIQIYLGKSFDIKFNDFKTSNPQLIRFTDLINKHQPAEPTRTIDKL